MLDRLDSDPTESRNFDRTGAAKLEGCFTRWREYRWSVFLPSLERLPGGSEVLDVGCGSLVETNYLVQRGLAVTGIDLDDAKLDAYRLRYDWRDQPPPVLRAVPLLEIAAEPKRFALITAFDMIEHVPNLGQTLSSLRTLLAPGGRLLATVPNKLTASELQGAITNRALRAAGRTAAPGVAHVQFKSPQEWRRAFLDAGLKPLAWEMAIGPLVNTWATVVSAPIQLSLMALELAGAITRSRRHELVMRLARSRKMSFVVDRLHVVDEALRPVAEGAFAWNLVVLGRSDD